MLVNTYLLATPQIARKVIAQDQVLIVRVTEEIALDDRLVFVVEEFERVLIGELHDRVLQAANLFEHLVRNLRIQADCAMFELMER